MHIKDIALGIKENIEALHQYSSTPDDGLLVGAAKGTTRLPFTKEARGAVEHIKNMMAEAGLSVEEDTAGNVIGTMKGKNSEIPAIVTGSHFDTVINGGNFDGLAGIMSGIAVAKLLNDNHVSLDRDYVVVAFNDEEGMRFGSGYFGSKAILGQITMDDLHNFKDKDGISIYQAMKEYGLSPEDIFKAKWQQDRMKSFIEVHIEQGPVLYERNQEIGLVDCIVGMQRYMINVLGRADHAGTTPMDMRIDAVEAAAKVIAKIPDWAREKGEGTVATTGYLRVLPGGVNIVAEDVQFSVDVRSKSNEVIDDIVAKIRCELDASCKNIGAKYQMQNRLIIDPVYLNEHMLSLLQNACEKYGYKYQRILSGAGHDALAIAQTIDTVMVFVPSKDGRSHCAVEWTEYEDIAKAVTIIYDLVLDMQ